MTKERLDEMLSDFRQLLALGQINMDILNKAEKIHEIIIQQADRVQELEKQILYRDLALESASKITEELAEENKRYREALEHIKEHSDDKVAVFIAKRNLEGEE